MRFFGLFRKNPGPSAAALPRFQEDDIDRSGWTGKDFEFMIIGKVKVRDQQYDDVMTPNSLPWIKELRDGWTYYKVGDDAFTYSWETPGIQMTFSPGMPFGKAKKIAEEVLENLYAKGQKAGIMIIETDTLYRFEGNSR